MSEAIVKTNRMASTKWTYYKQWSFAGNYFIFFKFCFSLKNSYIFHVPLLQIPIFLIFVNTGVLFDGAFSL